MASSSKVEDRKRAANALSSSFSPLPDKEQGWKVMMGLAQDQDSGVRGSAASALRSSFALLPDKEQGWKVLMGLAQDQDSSVRDGAADALRSSFSLLSDKEVGWKSLLKLAQDKDIFVRGSAAQALCASFALHPNKELAWQDLHRLTQDQDSGVRWFAASALCSFFAILPDKKHAWQDLLKLAQDRNILLAWFAANALSHVFSLLPDKEEAWQDLHRFTRDQDRLARGHAAHALGLSFGLLPDKELAWQDLHRLTRDQDSFVRGRASHALGLSFVLLTDKEQAWQDLHRLTQDLDKNVRASAAEALSSLFAFLPDKEQGWKALVGLAKDPVKNVRANAAEALGSSFDLLPDKEEGWKVLLGLSEDQDCDVRTNAYHSLGRASIYKATESKDKTSMRSELEVAVNFFERSSQELSLSTPARFCLPFYRSYLALTFQGASEAEVQKYLSQAKAAVGSSENKKELFGAVENLARALEETQKLKERSKEQIQSDLEAYRWYCDRAAEHMAAAEEKSPVAVRLMKKCNPIIEERIEETVAEIQKTAKEICQVTRGSGTAYEAPGARINQEARRLSLKDPIEAFKSSTRIASILREFCSLLPEGKSGHACEIVGEIEAEPELSSRLSKIELALTHLQPNIHLEAYESAMTGRLDQMDKKLDTVIYDLAKIKIGSGNIFANLCAVRSGLAVIAERERKSANHERESELLSQPDADQKELGNLIEAKVLELEEILKTKATKEDNQSILDKLESLKPSAGWEWLGRMADLIAIFDASIKVLQFLP